MFNRIRPVIQRRPPVILSLRELVKDLIPEPDAKIVNRLISYFPSNNFKIRAPWSLLPNNVATYDLENVKFYARILTMLAQLGVYPPVKTQIQGITPSKIFRLSRLVLMDPFKSALPARPVAVFCEEHQVLRKQNIMFCQIPKVH